MPTDYKNISQPKKKISADKHNYLAFFFIGLISGTAITAAIAYVYRCDNNEQQIKQPEITIRAPEQPPSQKTSPTFDFYQILPSMNVNIPESKNESNKIRPEIQSNGNKDEIYILQIGSFRRQGFATEMKAKLALIGISADIQRVVINDKDIRYRVRIGPYTNLEEIPRIKEKLTDNNFDYTLLKLSE